MFTGYSTVSSVVVLWLMLGYVYFFYLIRTVVFFNWYHSLDIARYCRVKFSCSFCFCDVFRCFVRFLLFPVVGLVLQRGCPSPGCGHISILCSELFLSTVL